MKLSPPVRWFLLVGVFVALLSGCGSPKSTEQPRGKVLGVPSKEAKNYDLKVEQARDEGKYSPPIKVPGQVVPNPSAMIEVRTATAGTLRPNGNSWPVLGQQVGSGTILGWVDVRVGPQERLDLLNRLREASKKLDLAQGMRVRQQARLERMRKNSELPLRDVEEAEIQLLEATTQEGIARDTARTWQEALTEIDHPGQRRISQAQTNLVQQTIGAVAMAPAGVPIAGLTQSAVAKGVAEFAVPNSPWSQPLRAPAAGEITEVAARPGMVVEAGALLFRLVNFRRPLVRLDIPTEALIGHPPPDVVELAVDRPRLPTFSGVGNPFTRNEVSIKIKATRIGIAPQVDSASQRAGYLYQADIPAAREGDGLPALIWRPGLSVKAELPGLEANAQEAVSVPADALREHQGHCLVYVQLARSDEKMTYYARKTVQVLGRKGDRVVLAVDDDIDDKCKVVVKDAQLLLSQEFKTDDDD